MTGPSREDLSEAEIEQLVALLAAIRNPGALSLEAVDGLFCALIASPALVMPHEYLPVILGELWARADCSATSRGCRR
jgi:uncharacterized protein